MERYLGETTTMVGEVWSADGSQPGNMKLGRRLVVKLLKSHFFPSPIRQDLSLTGLILAVFRTTCLSRLPAFQHLANILTPYDFDRSDLPIDAMDAAAQVSTSNLDSFDIGCSSTGKAGP